MPAADRLVTCSLSEQVEKNDRAWPTCNRLSQKAKKTVEQCLKTLKSTPEQPPVQPTDMTQPTPAY
jgi:hypothetical protein